MTNAGPYIGKLSLLISLLMLSCGSWLAMPANAAETWSQYGRIGMAASAVTGGFSSPGGIAADSSGNIYVADYGNDRVQKLDLATNTWSVWEKTGGGKGSGLGEFNGPNGVAVDGSGNVYVADMANHRIQKLDADTNTWSAWGKLGGGTGSGPGEFNSPDGVAVDGHGNVYVADTGNDRIQKLDSAANTWSEWNTSGSGLGEFDAPGGLTVDGHLNVYVADKMNHRIQKLDALSNTWSEWGKTGGGQGSGLGEFTMPTDVSVDDDGNVYVSDAGNHRIQKLDIGTNTWSEWKKTGGGQGTGLGEFNTPTGVYADSGGNIYVADTNNNRTQKFSAGDQTWSERGVPGPAYGYLPGEFSLPTGVAVDGDGNVYVAERGNHRVQKLTIATNTWSVWAKDGGGAGSGLGEFNAPAAVAVDGSGSVYVADYSNHRIQKLTVSSGTWSEWKKSGGGPGNGPGEFNNPNGIALDSDGNLYVADRGNHRIQKLTVSSGTWSEWRKSGGGSGNGLGEFNVPVGVAVDGSGNVYVADYGNNRIQKLTVSSDTWSEWKKIGGGSGAGLGEFYFPSGVAVDGSGNVYVADTRNQRVQKLTISTNTWSEWRKNGGGAGTGLGEFTGPSGVAVDSEGRLYVAESGTHRIQKLTVSTVAAPGAPTGVTAAAGNGEATVSFTPPASDGGSAIAGYTVTASPGDITATGPSSPITVTGLTNGTTYTFTVVATNGAGDSSPSSPSAGVTPVEGQAAAPAASPAGGAVASGTTVTLTSTTPDTVIHYTLDGSTPTASSPVYSSPIVIIGAQTVKAIAVRLGMADSGVTTASYSIAADPPPTSNPAPQTPATGGVDVLVNGKVENAGTAATSRRDGQTVVTIEVDEKKLEQRLASEGDGAVITLPVHSGADVVIGELNGRMVKNMESRQAVVEIRTASASYTLPAKQIDIDAIFAQSGGNAELQDIKVKIEIAEPKAATVQIVRQAAADGNFALVVPALAFTVQATYGDRTVEVSKFNAYVERTIAIPEGVDSSRITTGVVVEPDGKVRHVPTKIVQMDGKYFARINSLTNSTYSVVWHPLAFSDAAGHWAAEAVNDMGSRMVMNGFQDGTFKPNRDMTRAEFAAILVRGLGLRPETGKAPFSDIQADDWYNAAVQTASAYGLISGFEDGSFRPMEQITREQAMVIVAKAMKLTGLRLEPSAAGAGGAVNGFADAAEVSKWAAQSIAECLQAELVSGRSGTQLAPKATIARAEAAVIVERLLKKSDLI